MSALNVSAELDLTLMETAMRVIAALQEERSRILKAKVRFMVWAGAPGPCVYSRTAQLQFAHRLRRRCWQEGLDWNGNTSEMWTRA